MLCIRTTTFRCLLVVIPIGNLEAVFLGIVDYFVEDGSVSEMVSRDGDPSPKKAA